MDARRVKVYRRTERGEWRDEPDVYRDGDSFELPTLTRAISVDEVYNDIWTAPDTLCCADSPGSASSRLSHRTLGETADTRTTSRLGLLLLRNTARVLHFRVADDLPGAQYLETADTRAGDAGLGPLLVR